MLDLALWKGGAGQVKSLPFSFKPLRARQITLLIEGICEASLNNRRVQLLITRDSLVRVKEDLLPLLHLARAWPAGSIVVVSLIVVHNVCLVAIAKNASR